MAVVLTKARYITDTELEATFDAHLRASGLMPTREAPVLDVEAFIENHLKARLEQYCPHLKGSELGVTDFLPGVTPKVRIQRALTEAADSAASPDHWSVGRWRFTMAHEAAHVVLHRGEVEAAFAQLSLFDVDGIEFRFAPYSEGGTASTKTDPREYQANRGAAALLMPRSLFIPVVTPLIAAAQTFQGEDFFASRAFDLVLLETARCFRVSKQAARLRFDALGLAALRGQVVLDA